MIGYAFRECSHTPPDCEYVPSETQPYGSWLCASNPPKTIPSRNTRAEAQPKDTAQPELSIINKGNQSKLIVIDSSLSATNAMNLESVLLEESGPSEAASSLVLGLEITGRRPKWKRRARANIDSLYISSN
ncbi:hypothetical protein ACOSQ4_022488 [Xanthoceras sorbifolium]